MFNVSKKHSKPTCQIYQKLAIKTPERHLVLLLLILYFALYSTGKIAEFEQANAGWAWKIQTMNLFLVTVRNTLSSGLGKFFRLYFLRLHRHQVSRRCFKNKSNPELN